MSKSDDDIPDLMSALKASLDAVKARDADPEQMRRVQEISAKGGLVGDLFGMVSDDLMSKHDDHCMERRREHPGLPLLCTCGISDNDWTNTVAVVKPVSEMTQAQSLAHRYAAEAGRRADALRAFRECLRYAAVAEANEDTVCADAHRADARAAMHMYPEMLAGLEAAVGGGLFR